MSKLSRPVLLKPKPWLEESDSARRLAIDPVGMPVCCLKRAYSWLGATGVWWSSETSRGTMVEVGLVMADGACEVKVLEAA